MSIKITDKVLSIPPYISTSWTHISAIHMKAGVLAVTLLDGDTLHIPNLTTEEINLIFQCHAAFLEKEFIPLSSTDSAKMNLELMKLKGLVDQGEPSIRFAFGTPDGIGNMLQHNAEQANAPDLPPDVLQKIVAISKIIAPPEELALPKAEQNCNCFYCQIARVINPNVEMSSSEELDVNEDELQFQQWSIIQTGDKLFTVVNRLDTHEKYNVFLGQPIGCTCGKDGCEHILAVLKS